MSKKCSLLTIHLVWYYLSIVVLVTIFILVTISWLTPYRIAFCADMKSFPVNTDPICDSSLLCSLVCYTAVFSVVTERSSPPGEERCVTTLKTAPLQKPRRNHPFFCVNRSPIYPGMVFLPTQMLSGIMGT